MSRNTLVSKLLYASGTVSFSVKDVAFGSFVLFYYTTVVGLQGSLAGAALFIAMAWDAITDPVVGSFSDHLVSRWGRRHPLMAISGIPLAICLFALFNVPDGLSQWQTFAWMLAVCVLLRTFLTIFTVPYLALGAELSTDYLERSSIAGMRTIFGWISGIVLAAAAWGLIFSSTGETDGRLVTGNYYVFGVTAFCIVALFTTLSIIGTANRIPGLPKAHEDHGAFSPGKMLGDIMVALRNFNFRMVFFVSLTIGVATGVNAALGTHMSAYFWELTTDQIFLQTIGTLIPIALMMAFMGKLNEMFEKQTILKLCILIVLLNSVWFVPGRLLGLLPENHTAFLFYVVVAQGYISVVAIIWFQAVAASYLADIADEQELLTNQRQEGVFFAAQGFSLKFVTGAGNFIGGIVIDFIRLPVGAAPGTVDGQVLFELGLVMGPGMVLALVVPYCFARQLTLSRARHAEIRAELDARHRQRA